MTNATLQRFQTSSAAKLLRRAATRLCLLMLLICGIFGAQTAQAGVTIEPVSWNVVGLDSNNPQAGPAEFPVGARVCNTGGAAVTNIAISFLWDSTNININLKDSTRSTLTTSSLAAGACVTYYFDVVVTRSNAAYNTARRFHITASGDGIASVSTPTPRELFVERLISQGRNTVTSVTGPTSVYVGQTYTYTVNASTATGGYEQLEMFLNLSSVVFEVQSVSTTYSAPTGGTNDKIYADACGWQNNPTIANYRSCVGPIKYSGGKAGGTIRTVYVVKVLSSGATFASTLIRDFSGSSYHYNADFGTSTISISAQQPPANLSGTIFEDVNYGGGAGRSLTASAGVGRGGARVELYNASGGFVTATTSDATGRYVFTSVAAGNYTVRVVNSTVTSSRSGATAGLLPVQTFRHDASSGTAQADANRVGGQNPQTADAASGAAGTTINTTTGVFTAGTTGTAASIAPVFQNGANVIGIDFGFNFSIIVNTNNTGQGSLRQFITNSNALTNAGLNQSLPAGIEGGASVETSVFMISDGVAHPGLRTGLPNMLTGGVAAINVLSSLPAITDSNTNVHGGTQTANIGNTNAGSLGAGGTVGVDNLSLSIVARPEVQLVDGANLAVGLDAQANSTTIRALAIYGFGNAANSDANANIRIGNNFTNALIESCVIGSSAVSFTDPGAGARSGGDNVRSVGGDGGTLRNNLIGFSAGKGFGVEGGSTGWTIEGNEIRGNGIGNPNLDGIDFETAGSTGNTARRNLIIGNEGVGVDSYLSNGSNTIVNNTITANGAGAGANVETAGVRLYGTNNTIERNLIFTNYGAGVMVAANSSANLITRNSIYNNGTINTAAGGAPSNQIGIDLLNAADSLTAGTSPFVTLNDNADADTGGNGLLNFPVIERANISAGQLTVTGFARPGAILEFFIAAPDPSGFGEGQTYLVTLTEGSAADTDATIATYTSPVANRNVGTDTTNRFSFTLALPAGVTLGSVLTATATVALSTSEFSNNIVVANLPPNIGLVKSVSPEGNVMPGAELTYTIAFTNSGGQPATNFRLIDPDPASGLRLDTSTAFKLGSAVAALGTIGLTVAYEYSNDNGATWGYTPVSGAGGAPAGYDNTVTHIRWTFTGSLSQSAPNNAGSVSFVVRVR